MITGKIAYLIQDPDYDENDEPIPNSGTWELKYEVPYYGSGIVKKIVYFEVE